MKSSAGLVRARSFHIMNRDNGHRAFAGFKLEPHLSDSMADGKHAEPLILALVQTGNDLRQKLETNLDFEGKREWLCFPPTLPAPIARLTQYLLEGVEAETETLTSAQQLVVFFAQGC